MLLIFFANQSMEIERITKKVNMAGLLDTSTEAQNIRVLMQLPLAQIWVKEIYHQVKIHAMNYAAINRCTSSLLKDFLNTYRNNPNAKRYCAKVETIKKINSTIYKQRRVRIIYTQNPIL